MKTNEFIKAVENLGYLVDDGYGNWQIWNEKSPIIATVSKIDLFRFSTDFGGWWDIPNKEKSKLLDIIVEFAKTPIEDRKEEKKFYLKHRFLTSLLGDMQYSFINYDTKYNDIYLSSNEADYVKTKFTLKEIEEIKKKFDTDLADFEMVEVEE